MALLGHAKIATAPSFEPVTREEAKKQANVYGTQDDAYVDRLVTAARRLVEKRTRRQIMPATWDFFIDSCFPYAAGRVHGPRYAEIRLPRPPLRAVTHVKYIAPDGTLTTLVANTDYSTDTHEEPGRVVPAYGTFWPTARDVPQAVQIRYTAGYSLSSDSQTVQQAAVPQTLKQGVLFLVSHWFAQRDPVVTGTIATEIADTLDAILACDMVKEAA